MKTLITALAVAVILATSAIAKTERTKTAHPYPNDSVTRIPRPSSTIYCHFHHGETDPDPRVRLQLVRDCRYWEDD
jgi:hypothetical protein